MSKSVATTKIEKQYKDKKTGEWKSITINYAKVVDRLNEFRSDYSNSKISTNHKILDDGSIVFKAYAWKDKTDFMEILKSGADATVALLSADSEGTAKSTDTGEKSFEKLETISLGRCLALLGYAGTGEIASSEEMEEFEKFKRDKAEAAIEALNEASTLEELKDTFFSLGKLMANPEVVKAKDARKVALNANPKV